MKTCALLLAILSSSISVFSQNFTFVSGNLVEKDLIIGVYNTAESKILNESDEAVTFAWEVVDLDYPFDWEYLICDYPNCYDAFVMTATMNKVSAGSETAFLQVSVTSLSEGIGTFSYAVWDEAFPEERDTLTFVLKASEFSVVDELNNDKIGITSRNSNALIISNRSGEMGTFELFNISGELVSQAEIQAYQSKAVSTSELNAGMYFIAYHRNGDTD